MAGPHLLRRMPPGRLFIGRKETNVISTSFARLGLAPLAISLAAAGCTMTGINALSGSAAPLPASNAGQTAYPAPASLTPLQLTAQDWATVEAKKVAPACDARGPRPVADAASLAKAKEVLERWNKLGESGKGAATQHAEAKGKAEVTITVTTPVQSFESGSLECDGERAALDVNGASVPFDLAYATTSHSGARPDDIDLMLTALSLKTGALVSIVVKPAMRTATFAMTDLRTYIGATPPEPVVYSPTGTAGGTFVEHDYFFRPAGAGGPGVYVMSTPSGNGNPSNLEVGRFTMQP
jgi:hypothetical protein